MKVVTLCGSLRKHSSNRAMLEAFASLLPISVSVVRYEGLSGLPHFNPDEDGDVVAKPVADLRDAVATADLIAISTPEYAHGLPGSLKNALDWLVSDPRVDGKRALLLAADRGSRWAVDSLLEILRTMSVHVDASAVFWLPLGTNRVDVAALLGRVDVRAKLQEAVRYVIADER